MTGEASHLISERVRTLAPSATLAINERSNELLAAGRRIFKLGLGQSPFPVPTMVRNALAEHAHEKDYLPVKGLLPLREAICQWLNRTIGVNFEPDNLIVGPGSKELLFMAQLVHDSRLCIPSPSWVSYEPQANLIGKEVEWIQTHREDGWRLTAAALDAACTAHPGPRLLILNYPNNPTGLSYGPDRLRSIAEVCRRHGVIVLSDEIYGELNHHASHRSIAEFYAEGTIVTGGLSKWCGAGGWRLGFAAAPPSLRSIIDAMAVVASETFTSVSAPIQHAGIVGFNESESMDRYLEHSRAIVAALGAELAHRLIDAGLFTVKPDGGFYLFVDFEKRRSALAEAGIHSAAELCEALLEDTGVACLPGTCFGRPPEELTLRLSYVNFDGAAALAALSEGRPVDSEFLESFCSQTLKAIELMCRWHSLDEG